MTDANLVLGRLNPEYFPKIFGPKENESLDINIAQTKFVALTKEINEYMAKDKESEGLQWTPMSVDEVAYGLVTFDVVVLNVSFLSHFTSSPK